MRSEHFLAICLELVDYNPNVSLKKIMKRANNWEKNNNRHITGIGQGDFSTLVSYLPGLRENPEAGGLCADNRVLRKVKLIDVV